MKKTIKVVVVLYFAFMLAFLSCNGKVNNAKDDGPAFVTDHDKMRFFVEYKQHVVTGDKVIVIVDVITWKRYLVVKNDAGLSVCGLID